MKKLALITVLSLSALALALQVMPEPPAASENHRWLEQLAGEWSATMEATMGPGQEPQKHQGSERARSLGGLWLVAEGQASLDGQEMQSLLTIGYDEGQKAFVGTWVDTMQTKLWVYTGTLDEARRTLTLEAEGPYFGDPTKTTKYRDAITIESADHKVLTSSVLGDDGTWTQFMRADYRRKQ